MGKKSRKLLLAAAGIFAVMLSGCNMRRKVDVSLGEEGTAEVETAVEKAVASYQLEQKRKPKEEIAKFAALCFGMDEERENMDDYLDQKTFHEGDDYVVYRYDNQKEYVNSLQSDACNVIYRDNTDGRADCYELVLSVGMDGQYSDSSYMRKRYPDEELPDFPKEQALEICNPYAEMLGYDSTDVHVYAVPYETLERRASPFDGVYYGAPNENAVDERNYKSDEKWKEDDAAYLLFYEQKIDGVALQGDFTGVYMVYVPKYKKPVIIDACLPYLIKEELEAAKVVDKADAVSEVIMNCGLTSQEDILVDDISLRYKFDIGDLIVKPYWIVCYHRKGQDGEFQKAASTVWVNAIDGMIDR